MSRKKQTRLELHRETYVSESGRVILLRFEELSSAEQQMVAKDIFSSIGKTGGDPYRIYAKVLSTWGIMCPHPQSKRLYGGRKRYPLPQLSEKYPWYLCECCESTCSNTDGPDQRKGLAKKKKV